MPLINKINILQFKIIFQNSNLNCLIFFIFSIPKLFFGSEIILKKFNLNYINIQLTSLIFFIFSIRKLFFSSEIIFKFGN